MANLPRIWAGFTRIFRAGVQETLDPRQAKRIVLSNQIAFSLGALCLLHVYIDQAMGARLLGWLNIPLSLGFFAILGLNRMGLTWWARFALLTYASAWILLYSLALGKESGMHLFFLPAGWAPLVLFSLEERRSLLFGILLNSALLAAFELAGNARGLLFPLTPDIAGRMHADTVITTLLIQILLAAYFFFGTRKSEARLAEAIDAAKAADQAKSRFLANMSHEIRTPLNGILGMSRMLARSGLPQGKLELARTLEESSLDLMVIVNEILDLSKIEAGKLRMEQRDFDLRKEVRSVLGAFGYEAGRKGLDLRLDADPTVPEWVRGDSGRLKQVLRNLIGNALKFTERGGVTLRLRPASGKSLSFAVEDTGMGIPENARERLFQSFSQADDSTARKFGGTGLGLHISRQIVELMGGSISFRAREGGGSVFEFTVSLPSVEPAVSASPDPGYGPRPPDGEAWRERPPDGGAWQVLLVDDHPVNCRVLQGMLEEYAVRADFAASAREALEACARKAYDLVFLDCHMPEMDGPECARVLRDRPAGIGERPLVIIGVTADVMPGIRERCLQAGMDDVLTKPVLEEDLRKVLAGRLAEPRPGPEADAGPLPADPGPTTWVDTGRLAGFLRTFRKHPAGYWRDALESFRNEAESGLRDTREALEAGDIAAAGESVHGLKGLCLTLGFFRLGDCCVFLERRLSSGEMPADWGGILGEMESALPRSLEEAARLAGSGLLPGG